MIWKGQHAEEHQITEILQWLSLWFEPVPLLIYSRFTHVYLSVNFESVIS